MLSSWYYITLLFENIPSEYFLQALVAYGFWLAFIVTLTIFFSSLLSYCSIDFSFVSVDRIFKPAGVVSFPAINLYIRSPDGRQLVL
ncbi:hypothetical protein BSG1_01905 [Bacillus sp. SG-1]|nr:hypothetical protein BSG1_01905 [Bacillus sp. SG-1]